MEQRLPLRVILLPCRTRHLSSRASLHLHLTLSLTQLLQSLNLTIEITRMAVAQMAVW